MLDHPTNGNVLPLRINITICNNNHLAIFPFSFYTTTCHKFQRIEIVVITCSKNNNDLTLSAVY